MMRTYTAAHPPSARPTHRRFGRAAPARPRLPWGRLQPPCPPALRPKPRLDPGVLAQADWPRFWAEGSRLLRAVGLRTGTLRVYRHVLRGFRTFLSARGAGSRPGCATPALAREFLYQLDERHASWSWTATHISALRTFFDKLGGAQLTDGIPTPKRPRRIHDVLDAQEVGRLLQAASATRDRLAILLLFGCGLRTSELCALRWSDVDLAGRTLRVGSAGGRPDGGSPCPPQGLQPSCDAQHLSRGERRVPLPANAVALLQAEGFFRASADPVFPGARNDRPLSVRTAERIVRRAAVRAGLTKEVTCRALRRSYAVECLRAGASPIDLRNNLGHRHIESTLAYARYLPPKAPATLGADFSPFRLPPVVAPGLTPAAATTQPAAP